MESFNEHFQRHLVNHLLRDSEFLLNVLNDLDPSIFSTDSWKRIVRLCVDFGKEFKAAPDTLAFRVLDDWLQKGLIPDGLHNVLSKEIDGFFSLALQNRSYLLAQYNTFLRQQKAKSIMTPFMEAIKKGDFEDAESLMKELFQFRPSRDQDLGRLLIADPSDRILRRRTEDTERFWTLIPEIDKRIDGLRAGELGVWQSQRTSSGKSAALQFLSRSFAYQGKKVLIFTTEMTEEAYEDRLDMCIAGIAKQALTNRQEIYEKLSRMIRQGGGIWYKAVTPYVTKISDLRKYADMIRNVKGFVPDAILIDYADEIAPEDSSVANNLFVSGRDVYGHFIGWLKEDKLVGWTGTQSGRAATEELVADQQHTGGSIAKAYAADLILSINRTAEEEEQGLTRIFVGKNRTGRARYSVAIKTDFERMQFWTNAGS